MRDGSLRDDFLGAIDANDRVSALRLAAFLTDSHNPLPSVVCEQLGLPKGSAYSVAARFILRDAETK